jgi:nicotinamidase-related amidase
MKRTHKNADLHGAAPDAASVALLIVDMLSNFQAPEVRKFLRPAQRVAHSIAALKKRADAAGIPCIYVNDNVGKWQSNGRRVIEQNSSPDAASVSIKAALRPRDTDYLILKPKHSAFYATPLDVLLSHLGVSALIITGTAGKQCILFTAIDAYVREYRLYLPDDCIVTESQQELKMLQALFAKTLDADTRASGYLRLAAMQRKHRLRALRK